MASHHVTQALSGQTVAAVVRQLLGNVSWTNTRKLIAARQVRINGTPCLDDARRLQAGEVVEIMAKSQAAAPDDVMIIFADEDVAVVEKPPGIQTVRRVEERHWSQERKARQPVLQETVASMLHGPPGSRNAGMRVRAVHRLDRDTSGLMVFALSGRAEQELIRRFSTHQIERVYRAVAIGNLTESRTVESWIVRDRGDGIRGSIVGKTHPPDVRRAVTHVVPIDHVGDTYTIIECRLETGRTHQIRIHLAEIGHMLCGEKVYLQPRPGAPAIEDRSGAPRQALHSAALKFDHPVTGKAMRYESSWPVDLKRWIERVQKHFNVLPLTGAGQSSVSRPDGM